MLDGITSTRWVAPLLFAFAGLACGDEHTAFPAGMEPLEATNAAARPAVSSRALAFARGESRDFEWVHARGFVGAPLAETWAAFRDPEVVTDRRQVDVWSVTRDVEPDLDASFVVHNTVRALITVDFDMTWRQAVVEGDADAPETVAIRFQKTFGTVFIDILRGSIVLRSAPEDPDVTELELIEHIDAAQGGADRLQSYLGDLHASVSARVQGQALPSYRSD